MVSGTVDLSASITWTQRGTKRVTVDFDTTSAPGVLNLPSLETVRDIDGFDGREVEVVINDAGNNAGTNNITINADGTDRIEGSASLVMSTDTETVILIVANDGNWAQS
jgi:hypothetical protein